MEVALYSSPVKKFTQEEIQEYMKAQGAVLREPSADMSAPRTNG